MNYAPDLSVCTIIRALRRCVAPRRVVSGRLLKVPAGLAKDGWPDVIAGGWGEDGIYWYKNPGNSAKERGAQRDMHLPWQGQLLARTRGYMEMFALHDFDKDGAPELHSASYRKHYPLEVWRFIKSVDGAPMLQPFVLGAEGGGHGYAFGDVNGDGREDVLCEAGWYERPAGDPFAKSWKFHAETALPHPSRPFAAKDLNQDGRLDIIFGRGHDVGLYWWEQQAPKADGMTVWKQHVIDELISEAEDQVNRAIELYEEQGSFEVEFVGLRIEGSVNSQTIYDYLMADSIRVVSSNMQTADSNPVQATVSNPGAETGKPWWRFWR